MVSNLGGGANEVDEDEKHMHIVHTSTRLKEEVTKQLLGSLQGTSWFLTEDEKLVETIFSADQVS
ncbi:hypothetical protein BK765_28700 [Bacillus thuringiensis serovar dakota]|nr:hypothetical protein BK765_28700 [Bacillus thuringiensis serovar dakota]